MRNSTIMKRVSFRIISSIFTLVMQSLFEDVKNDVITVQILSNLVTSAILNYGIVNYYYFPNKIRVLDYLCSYT